MKTFILPGSHEELTVLGLGTWAMGGGSWSWGWSGQTDEDSIRTIHEALDSGINWIDTAPLYGLGHAEELIGRVLKERKDDVFIATKCGLRWNRKGKIRPSLRADSIREECEASLRRLQVETLDLLQIHWPLPEDQIEEGWETLVQLKNEGKVRYIGVCNFWKKHIDRILSYGKPDTIQMPYHFLDRRFERELAGWCEEEHVSSLIYSPLLSGLLSGSITRERLQSMPRNDWRRRDLRFSVEYGFRILEMVDELKEIAQGYGLTMAQLAVAWVLHQPGVSSAIIGARRPGHVKSILRAGEISLSRELLEQINRILEAYKPVLKPILDRDL